MTSSASETELRQLLTEKDEEIKNLKAQIDKLTRQLKILTESLADSYQVLAGKESDATENELAQAQKEQQLNELKQQVQLTAAGFTEVTAIYAHSEQQKQELTSKLQQAENDRALYLQALELILPVTAKNLEGKPAAQKLSELLSQTSHSGQKTTKVSDQTKEDDTSSAPGIGSK